MFRISRVLNSVVVYFAAALASASLGCSSIAERMVEKPIVKLNGVGVRDVKVEGAVVVFAVEVENPNPFALKVDALKYDVDLGGKKFTSGTIDKIAQVEPHAKSIIELPIAVKYTDLFASMLDLFTNGVSKYRIKGEASVGLFSIPFDQSGELKLKP